MHKRVATFIFFSSLSLPSPAGASAKAWTYEVVYDAKAKAFTIEAELPAGARLDGDVEAVPFIQKAEILGKEGSKPLGSLKDGLTLPHCEHDVCRIRYVFDLGKTARKKIGESDKVVAVGDIILSNPAFWLLRPVKRPANQRVEFTFSVINSDPKNKTSIETGLFPLPSDPARVYTTADHLDDLPWTIVGPFHAQSYAVKGATIDLAIIPAAYQVSEAQILAWSKRASDALTAYYGEFPVPHVLVIVVPRESYKGPGKSFGDGGAVTINPLAMRAGEEELKKDWVMTHEMVHLAFPGVPYRQHWMEEGLATYIEPLARVRSGELKAEDVFRDMIEGMPQGLPKTGDGGLDGPANWGKTYWGGALFNFLADKELRVRSKGRVGLEDALRGIVKAGGTMAVNWDFQRALTVGDQATGYSVLSELYNEMKEKSVPVDLDDLWQKMGVERLKDGSVHFNDNAPLAYVRKGMVSAK